MKKNNDVETQVFNEVKDSKINENYLKNKYAGAGIDLERLVMRITKYQQKVYRCTLNEIEEIEKRSKLLKIGDDKNARRKERTNNKARTLYRRTFKG